MSGATAELQQQVGETRGDRRELPTLADPDPIDNAYRAYCRRLAAGEDLDADAYCAQFPHVQSSLRRLLQVHFYAEKRLAEEIAWPEIGQVFLGYPLILELGRGGLGRVFLASEPNVGDRLVVVKISPHPGTEAEILGRNPHPNIVPIFSVKEDSQTGLTAVVMPYRGSVTLWNLLDELSVRRADEVGARVILDVAGRVRYPLDSTNNRPMPDSILRQGDFLDGVRLLGAKIADALAYLHERGICHRDVKPSNVLLSPEGEPILLDFNLSADMHGPDLLMGGTLPYMAPEQLLAMRSDAPDEGPPVDARSDVFSLGVILYQLATGIHPFDRSRLKMPAAELCAHLLGNQKEGEVPAHRVNPRIEPGLSRLLAQCLAFDPRMRPQSAGEVAAKLRSDLTSTGRLRRWTAQHPGAVLTSTILTLALVIAPFAVAAFRAPVHEREADTGSRLYREGRHHEAIVHLSSAIRANPDAPDLHLARGSAYLHIGEYNQAFQDLQRADKVSPSPTTKAGLGYCLNLMGQTAEARAHYEEALKTRKDWPAVLNNLGFCCLKNNQQTEAKTFLDRAIQLDGRLQAAFHNRAIYFFRQAHFAMKSSKGAVVDPENGRLVQSALADVQEAKDCGPGSAELSTDAAFITALAMHADRRWAAKTLENLADAVRMGSGAAIFEDPAFLPLARDATFKNLRGTVVGKKGNSKQTRRLVNPLVPLPS